MQSVGGSGEGSAPVTLSNLEQPHCGAANHGFINGLAQHGVGCVNAEQIADDAIRNGRHALEYAAGQNDLYRRASG